MKKIIILLILIVSGTAYCDNDYHIDIVDVRGKPDIVNVIFAYRNCVKTFEIKKKDLEKVDYIYDEIAAAKTRIERTNTCF